MKIEPGVSRWKFTCDIQTAFQGWFNEWIRSELKNVADWNKDVLEIQCLNAGKQLHYKGHYYIEVGSATLFVWSVKPIITLRKGLKINVRKGQMIIS